MGESPGRVLVVDDSPVVAQLIAVNLELEGFVVSCAHDGQEALERAPGFAPDVITVDVVMVGLDGFETVRRLRADPRTAHIPIVMITARAQPEDVLRGERSGVEAYLTKPFEPAELVALVAGLARTGRPRPDDAADTLDR
jgi:CheY-like chemotaxis protein